MATKATVHEILAGMIEHWNNHPVEDVDQFLLDYEIRIHNSFHSLWFNGIPPAGQPQGENQVTRS